MKESKKIPLPVLRDRLQSIEHYVNPDYAFGELLSSWRVHTHKSWYTGSKGWLSLDDAKSFSEYAGYKLF